jgi:glycosyltransferase involved in cell wall biosynthesis
MSPLVTVVVPCYNYAQYLAAAVQSCLDQTLPPHQVIVVDDGSTDDTAAVALRFVPNVEYVWKENGGLSSARNAGAALATGDFVVFLDADDMLAEDYLERCSATLAGVSPDVAYAYTPVRYFGSRSGISRTSPFSLRTLRYGNYVNASAMIRREVLTRFSYSEELSSLEDFDFFLTLGEHGLIGVRVPEPLLLYRKHESMSDAMGDQWPALHRLIMARHPELYPWHVRTTMKLFHLLDRVPILSRLSWVARAFAREIPFALRRLLHGRLTRTARHASTHGT